MAQMGYKCPQCGSRYNSKFQMCRSIRGYECSCGHMFIREVYHQTNPQAASSIVSSQQFKPGNKNCMVGSAMYFAETPYDTQRKARSHGSILQAQVDFGHSKVVNRRGDKSITAQSLRQQGYDSVQLLRNGTEWVAYNPNQVLNVRRWG